MDKADVPLIEHVSDVGDRSLERVATIARDKGLPLRMRIAISLWDWDQYVAWKGQTWKAEVKDQAEAIELKEALEEFFDLMARVGPAETRRMIAEAMQALQKRNAAPGGEGQETQNGTVLDK